MINININSCFGNLPPGFFSYFLLVLDWCHNSIYTKENLNINWRCGENGVNLWDEIFNQPVINGCQHDNRNIEISNFRNQHKDILIGDINNIIPIYDKYLGWFTNNSKIYEDYYFQKLRDEFNKALSLISVKPSVLEKINLIHKSFIDKKTLGITVRIPKHYALFSSEGPSSVPLSSSINPEDFYEKILEECVLEFKKGNYDKIFVCCDVNYFINKLTDRLGINSVIYQDYSRLDSINNDWVDKNLPIGEEYLHAFIDIFLLSKTNFILGGTSNMFLTSLYFNNKINFKLFEILKNTYAY